MRFKMKTTLYIMTILLVSVTLNAGHWQWAESFGSQGSEYAWDLAVAQDNGGIWVAGEFTDSLTIDGITLPGYGLTDSFVLNYDPSGQFQWARAFGSMDGDVCLSVDVDASGNCYFTGYYVGSMTVEGNTITSNGSWDVYFGKLAPNGDLLWLRSFGGSSNDIGYGLAVNPDGSFLLTGWFGETMTMGPGISLSSYGGSDIYLAKFDTQGNCLWAHHAGTIGVDYAYTVDVDTSGNSYITGSASPGSVFGSISTDAQGMYVAAYSSAGEILWVLPSYNAGAINICVNKHFSDPSFGYVIGRVTGTATIGNTVMNSVDGSDDIYCARFGLNGNWLEVEHWGGPGSDKGRAVDSSLHTVKLASFEQTVNFNGSTLTSNGNWDLAMITDLGAAISVGSINSDVGGDIKLLSDQHFVVTGWFSGSMRMGSFMLDSGSDTNQDAFIACYNFDPSSTDDPLQAEVPTLVCYPNPCAEELRIANKSLSPISIYNIRGQKLRTLIPDRETGEAIWDRLDNTGRHCPPGIYLVKSQGSTIRVLLK